VSIRSYLEKTYAKNLVKAAPHIAGKIDKESFIEQLRQAWYPYVKKGSDLEEELAKARERIDTSGPFKAAFDRVGLTDDDLRDVLKSIQDDKPLQRRTEKPVGRNEPCPCGSGKKYKKCCGK
jgi:uncharacterized protein YecA (UPF0149 family)